jgi:glycosyltransferase involved in cell wall biosynthesis
MTSGEQSMVGFEATALELSHRSGVGHYTAHLLASLAQRPDDWRYALLTSRPLKCKIPPGLLIPNRRYFPNRSLWIQIILPLVVARLRPRLCHFTNSLAPLALSCPFVVTIYDMSLFLFPQLQPRKSLLLVRTLLPIVVRKAAAVITISHSAKSDILKVLHVPPQKVHVVYAAADNAYRVISDDSELERTRRKYRLEAPFYAAVSTLEPRKNLIRLVKAFAELRRGGRKEQLILVGQPGWQFGPLLRQIERDGLQGAVRLLGYVPAEDLPAIYNLARAVAFPSFYEGFGMPIVEAMACGTPVLTSNRSSMAEVASGAALLVDPTSQEEIEQGLLRLADEEPLREHLRAAGLERVARFSWAKAAEETSAVYRHVVS